MTRIFWREVLRLGFGVVVAGASVFGSTALAQVVPDNTLGSVVNDTGGGVQTITGGTTRETNLFHSFDRFSVPTNGTAAFDNATNIQNIFSRVTGGSISDIDGLIRANGAANLFLLNPNGIIFGPNARLNIGGSFVATTARSINFADGTQFSATPGTSAPLLTVNVPLGLQFGTNPGEIVNRSDVADDNNNFLVGLQVQPGKTLGLIGGNVNLEGGNLTAAGGRIELGAVAAPGVVGINSDNSGFRFSFPTDITLGNISLTDIALVDVRAGGGGSIAVNARNLNLTRGSQLRAGIAQGQGTDGVLAGDIDVNAQNTISIAEENEGFVSGIFNLVLPESTGNSGNINIKARSLSLTNDGVLSAGTFGTGNAGNIFVQVDDSISLSNGSTFFSIVGTEAKGNGGNIDIKARSLSLSNGATITTSTSGQGNAGNIEVQAQDSISLDNSNLFSNAVSQQETTPVIGNVGNIRLKARTISLINGSQIQASFLSNTRQQGSPGVVSLEATDSVSFAGRNSDNKRSAIFTDVESGAVAKGSDIQISAPVVSFNDAFLNTESAGQGDAGNINIQGQSLDLTNNSLLTTSTSGQGNAGNIQITATEPNNAVSFSGNSIIRTSSSGTGSAGNVTIVADGSVTFDTEAISSSLRQIQPDSTGQIPQVPSDRKGGDINITARSLTLKNGAQLDTSTSSQGNAGNINIDVSDTVSFDGFAGEFSSAALSNVESGGSGNGGNITLKARSLFLTNGAQIAASTFGQGNAGNIDVDVSDTISLQGANSNNGVASAIFSNVETGGSGNGGNITVKARSLSLINGAQITASIFGQGSAGNIDLDVSDTISLDDSSIFSSVEATGIGNGGAINIKARSLSFLNGAELITSTKGQGNAGNIQITATEPNNAVSFSGSSIIRTSSSGTGSAGNVTIVADGSVTFDTEAISSSLQQIQLDSTAEIPQISSDRKGGDINIKARSLSLTNSAQLSTSTFSQGNAGNINIEVSDTVSFDGFVGEFASAAFSNVNEGGIGNGGNINIKARSLSLTNGGQLITSTLSGGQGNAGNINIEVSDTVSFDGFVDEFTSAAFSNVAEGGIGDGGNVNIKARSLSITNGAEVNASNSGRGDAGDIIVNVRTLDLDNGRIFAESVLGNSGDIELQASRNVRLRNDSFISTSTASGNGGNITITSPLVVAEFRGNNDIFANAFDGEGGEIRINAQSIFGLRQTDDETLQSLLGTDTPTAEDFQRVLNQLGSNDSNDVAAFSITDPSLSGTVNFNADYIDPSRDIVELPTVPVDASALVAAGCPSGAENRFTVTGRGGLPPAPGNKLAPDALLTDWATLQTPATTNRASVESTKPNVANTTPNLIVEATSWQYDRHGAIILTSGDTASPHHLQATPTSCPST